MMRYDKLLSIELIRLIGYSRVPSLKHCEFNLMLIGMFQLETKARRRGDMPMPVASVEDGTDRRMRASGGYQHYYVKCSPEIIARACCVLNQKLVSQRGGSSDAVDMGISAHQDRNGLDSDYGPGSN